MWEFLGRFSGVLQLAEVPSLSELATAVANPGPDSRDPFNSVMVRTLNPDSAIVRFVCLRASCHRSEGM